MRNKFSYRSKEVEVMDDLDGSGPEMKQTLQELDIINRKLGGNKVTIDGLEQLIKKNLPPRPITIADIGCGGGDILKAIAKWAINRKCEVVLTGIDANPNIVAFARRNAVKYPQIKFEVINIFSGAFKKQTYDIVICSLFTHHFKDEQLVTLFAALKRQARVGVVINDLHRHWLAYYSIKILVNVLSKSPMVRHDAPVSVLRAFRKAELKRILRAAGIKHYSLKWMWAFRWQLIF